MYEERRIFSLPRTELSVAPSPLSSMYTRTQAEESRVRPNPPGPSRADGRPAALEELLRDVYAPLRRYITRLAGGDLADDSSRKLRSRSSASSRSCASPLSSAHGPSGSLRVLRSRISNALAAGSRLTTLKWNSSPPLPSLGDYPMRRS